MGDYPRRGKEVSISVVLSNVTASGRMGNLFARAGHLIKKQGEVEKEKEAKIGQLYNLASRIPVLD